MNRLPGETSKEMADRWIAEQPARLTARAELSRPRRILDWIVGAIALSLLLAAVVGAAVFVGYALVVGVSAVWERLAVFAGLIAVVFAGSYLARRYR